MPMVKPHITPKTQTAGFMIFSSLMLLILMTVVLALFQNRLHIQEAQEAAPTRRIQDLMALLKQAETKRSTLESEVVRLRKKMLAQEKTPPSSAYSESAGTQDPELKKLYQMAGLTPITGEGITITLQDNASAAQTSPSGHNDPNAGKLQAEDILRLVNELKAAGAAAISINDQRVVVTTEIVAAGPTISVNQTRLTQPVVVKAIGEPDVLVSALKIRGGILEYLDFFGIKVAVEKENSLRVPAYKGPLAS